LKSLKKILIVSRALSYKSEKVYDIPNIFKPALDSLFTLKKHKDWTVDIIFLNYRGIYTPNSKGLKFSWIYETMPCFMHEATHIAITRGYDYLMIVEPDIVLPKNALNELMDTLADGCDIAVGIYPERPSKIKDFSRRGQPLNGWLVCMPWNKNPKAERNIARRLAFSIEGCAGFGCVLMGINAIQNCIFPQRGKYGDGPDFGFYERARALSLKVYANPNVRCGHIENDGKIIRGPP